MKRFLLIISFIFSLAVMQAQTLKNNDIVSISFKNTPWNTLDYYTYMEASTSGILSKTYATDDCLWRLKVTEVSEGSYQYAFEDLTTGKYLAVHNTGSNQEALRLSEAGAKETLFSFTEKEGKEGEYMYGELYYNTVTHWGQAMPLWVSEYGGIFMVANWNAYDLYIEKWEQKGAGKPTGHFNPSKIEFSYIGDQEEENEKDDDPHPVTFMIEATTESYYKCIRRPDEALLRHTTNDVAGGDVKIVDIYWESDSINRQTSPNDLESNLNITADKYIDCPETDGRAILSLSQPTGGQDGKWQFTITPEGASPMGLKQKIYEETVNGTTVGIDRWVDYADRVVVEYQYGKSEPQKAHMRVVRKSYHEEELPALTFSINPLTYTFAPMMENKVFDVVAKHQHGKVIYNVDNQAIVTTYESGFEPKQVDLTQASYLDFSFSGDGASWLEASTYSSNQILVKTKDANDGQNATKRSSDLTVKITPQNHADHDPMSVLIPLHQRAVEIEGGGIQFIPNKGVGNTSFEKNPYTDDDQQQVHTVEKTIYYTPNQAEIELRLQESGYSGYMRWYDYETGGDPYYNYTHDITGASTTSWVRSPRGNNNAAFSAINTPRQGATEEEMRTIIAKEGHSHGLYTLNKADGGALDEANPYNNNPILKPWADGAAHIIACDVSAYTDYEVKKDNYGQITSITEPTLSYRQIFHLRPAEEMADRFAALGEDEYLEEYKYQAPAGKQILLATEYRYKKFRSHLSEMCYFYWANGSGNQTWIDRIADDTPVVWREFIKNSDGTLTENPNFIASYSAEMDYLIVRNDVYPATKVYTLELPGGNESWVDERYTNGLRIARFEVEFVDIEKQGPTNKTIITQQRINTQFKKLTDPITFDNITTHLPWEQASYGYVYDETTELGTTKYKRGADQGCFPFYGEYTVLASVDKGWAQASAHGGTGKSLYVDGTMEPGLVASIEANATICTGQTMYCSAWFCNPTPSGWSGEGNPIFRCNIQGKNTDETEWHDAGVYFVGELLKGTGWQQVVFPIESAHSYDQTRVSIYNFATTNQGNDFMVDDINLYVSQLPIAAYQGKMACRSTGDGTTLAAAVLRLDYSNINTGSDGFMYYQIYNESYESKANPNDPDTIGGYPVNLMGDAAYYHENTAHNGGTHDHSYGSIHIPDVDFDPEKYNVGKSEADKVLIYQSVSKLLDEMAANGTKHAKAYIKTENSGVVKWLLYVAHLVENVSETQVNEDATLPLKNLFDQHEYTMRMAYSPDELDVPACNLQTPIHATQKTIFRLRNSDGDVIHHLDSEKKDLLEADVEATKEKNGIKDITRVSINNCANDLYFLTATIVNHLALGGVGTATFDIEAPIYADWLVGEEFDDVYNDGRPATGSPEKIQADAAFLKKYGYTRGQVASAIMYDMRRVPTEDEPNPNYTARSLKELQPSAFESYQNYEIVKHLCDSGWLQMYDTTTYFYLAPNTTARYWCFPIEGTAVAKYESREVVVKDCNEPKWVSISSQDSKYYLNLAPIKNDEKTNQQKTQIPAIKVLEGSKSVTVPINELSTIRDKETNQTTPNVAIIGEGKNKINLTTSITLMDMKKGRPSNGRPDLEPGKEYTVRLQLQDLKNGWEYIDGTDSKCLVGYVFVTIQVVPKTLVWSPDEISFTGWGLNDNWIGWNDKNEDGKINKTDDPATNEVFAGFVPIPDADVIIPKLDNPLAYPYIVHEGDTEYGHKHNHYPMTIGFEPHSCKNIYFAPGALLHNQHVLHYKKAFVDMQITAGSWHMVSAPLKGMVSGDMFIPHNGWWSSDNNNLIAEPLPFEVKTFEGEGYQGIRHADAAYAFWEAFYNTTVSSMTANGAVEQTASAEFIQSNTLIHPLTPGSGYQLYGLGHENKEALTIRLPKPDERYDYYTNEKPNGQYETIPQEGRGKLAFKSVHEDNDTTMTIELSNKVPSKYFLFGNPTMAYIDMHALFVDPDNSDSKWTGNFQGMSHNTWQSVTQLTMVQDRYLPPMTSVLLESSAENTKMTIYLKPYHLTLYNTVDRSKIAEERESISARRIAAYEDERPTNEDAQATEMLTIYALGKNATARIVLATNPIANDYYQVGEDALFISTGVENQSYVTSPLNMYTVAEQVPMMADVRQGISNIPLSILAADKARTEYMQLAFYLTSNWSRTCYFCDTKTGQKIRIMDGLVISIEMPENHEQRYYIEGPDTYQGSDGVVTSTTQPSVSTTGNKVWAYAPDRNTVVVSSSDLIKSATLYDITGRLIAQSPNTLITNSITLYTTGTAGVYIVDVTLRDGSTERAQVIVQ